MMETSSIIVKQFRTGGDRNFGYLVACQQKREALVIDASFDPDMIVTFAHDHGFVLRYLFSTHGHSDHTNGNEAFMQMTALEPLLYGSTCSRTGIEVIDGALFPLGLLNVCILYTPGHTSDSMCLHIDNALFTGDTLFTGKVGGTTTEEQAREEYNSLHQKIMNLPDNTTIYPGHDYGVTPTTSIMSERINNPFLQQETFKDFLFLKENWVSYKKSHGIL